MRPNNVKLERVKADLSQAQLADLTGIAQERLSRIETGRVKLPNVYECQRIGIALGLAVEYLFPMKKAPI